MRIINKTKDFVLAEEGHFANTMFTRIKGLLGKKALPIGQALILARCNSIHTMFMKFPIDVLFVDKDYRVIKIITSFAPFRISGIYLRASFTIELPAGIVESSSTSVGDIIHF